jgi:ankyrin repeat protein
MEFNQSVESLSFHRYSIPHSSTEKTSAVSHASQTYLRTARGKAIISVRNSTQHLSNEIGVAKEGGSNFATGACQPHQRKSHATWKCGRARNRREHSYMRAGNAISRAGVIVPSGIPRMPEFVPIFSAKDEPSLNHAVLIAAATDNAPLMEQLLLAGANMEAKDGWGRTPLMMAIVSRSQACMNMLLEKGADLKALDVSRNTLMMYATSMNDVNMVHVLRRTGGDADARNLLGNTALVFAIEQNNLLIVEALLSKEINGSLAANPVAWNLFGKMTLFLAMDVRSWIKGAGIAALGSVCNPRQGEIVSQSWGWELRKNEAIIAALIRAGADVNIVDSMGNTILNYAANMHDTELLSMLKCVGENLN